MSEISSGLVAVRIDTDGYPLVRLSDAEAIIAQKDAEILEQCRLNGMGAERELHLLAQVAAKDAEIERLKHKSTIEDADTTVDHLRAYAADNGYSHGDYADVMSEAASQIEQQSERIKELESDVDEEAYIQDRMAKLLAETAVALKGPEKALHRHGWQDLPDVAAKQSAALKLAMEALVTARDTFTRYSLHHEAKGDFEKAQANKAFADSLKKAIAAIDAAPTPPVSEDRWLPIETAPKETTQMFVVVAFGAKVGATPYNSDPWCVWHQRGEFVRWPHKFSPTHWMPLPEAPAMQEDKL